MSRTHEHVQDPEVFPAEDEKFDLIYKPNIRELSSLFWTPVAIAAAAAKLLVMGQGTRVLDIGSGAGKFCLVAAALTDGCFITGIEQRFELVAAARKAAASLDLSGIDFLHGNVTDIDFADYDAFYLFNPFEENMHGHMIDAVIPLSPHLFQKYTKYVAEQLGARPLGTRVVTYMGYADDIPACYDCESALFGDDLKLWIKNRDHDPEIDNLGLRPSRSYRGSLGWQTPRNRA